jgi:DNA gyrase subunit A
MLVEEDSDLLLVSRKGMSIRFTASDDAFADGPRATLQVVGCTSRDDDTLLDASVVADTSLSSW